jgi:hypothetical protein
MSRDQTLGAQIYIEFLMSTTAIGLTNTAWRTKRHSIHSLLLIGQT